jgi:hypothetical protein
MQRGTAVPATAFLSTLALLFRSAAVWILLAWFLSRMSSK